MTRRSAAKPSTIRHDWTELWQSRPELICLEHDPDSCESPGVIRCKRRTEQNAVILMMEHDSYLSLPCLNIQRLLRTIIEQGGILHHALPKPAALDFDETHLL